MKRTFRLIAFLVIFLIPCINAISQDAFVVIDYMKVERGKEDVYLSIEKEWKKVHEKRIETGLIDGWQLWQKLFAGEEDPYQFVTITWYESFSQTNFKYPEDFWEDIFTEKEYESLQRRTKESRIMARREIQHRVIKANNSNGADYLLVNRMRVSPGRHNEYINMEREIWKPLQEESISRGFRSHWAIWQTYPFAAGSPRFTAIDGFEKYEQISTVGSEIIRKVHPEMSWEEIDQKAIEIRKLVSTEIWEIVDRIDPR